MNSTSYLYDYNQEANKYENKVATSVSPWTQPAAYLMDTPLSLVLNQVTQSFGQTKLLE
jgi:hypothetical protein